ncbi:TetR/AcrR family transcriptional regulator [Pediococcus inopinatus]|uniref:TetR/AcrR family transcriptional regulator n=1 Tax=Pediococcus inopinatus TaxID=114090 RepID=A0ABZ0Q4J3_9LACO|nr:TetR/AcrR family transcriptional regulator [Pediococcus inopinatus]AVL01002.1 TetR family transcriptional regulator [Pediococcus inopinatus]KRN62530.1 hypothetical protein IV83_GL002035 [Pediococcus inopinatus]WPC16688.1 TetR/AcrR family transcriptional regulator [Pediococcus inopinatus]WPC20184.1 TetR/AcrR family transcriptional regulator [Pediococcus inopinatus]WPC21890.1 TetR/AcrR family transcriptional regulator [Pediococcus inopinatus]
MKEKQQKIFDAAQKDFQESGFKGTNIAEITQHAGVAVGTFYRFYESKEEVFFQVYAAENERVKQEIVTTNDLTEDPRTLFPKIMTQLLADVKNSLILQDWYTNPKLKRLIKNNPNLQDDFMCHTVSQLVKQWQKDDRLKSGLSESRVHQLFEALVVVDNHQDELLDGDYEQLREDLVQGILDRILK